MDDPWSSIFYVDNILFSQLRELANQFRHCNEWPGLSDYNQLLILSQGKLASLHGAELKFVAQDAKTSDPEESYEARIYRRGEIQTRSKNWHDFFQVLIWCTYSNSKRLINKIHYLALSDRMRKQISSKRSNTENTLTLFDECGAVIVSCNPGLIDLIRQFEWTELFLHKRALFETEIKCFIFGHALFEKCLKPYIGMTAHCICLNVAPDFFLLDESEQKKQVDLLTCKFFNEHNTLTTSILDPLPILGIPHWDNRNEDPGFYQNKEYFRAKRKNLR